MLASYAIGLSAVALLAVAWLAVQGAWRRVFPECGAEPDALAVRRGCRHHSAASPGAAVDCRGCGGSSRRSILQDKNVECPLSIEEEVR